jgi:hypothetical protein
MKLKPASILFGLVLACQSAAMAGEDAIAIGQWRTELGKALVCGGEEADTIIDIATNANAFYSSGANSGSPEYEAYFSLLEKARNERRCFVTAKMRHLPDSIVYPGPESLEAQGKRFKVIGTTIEEDGERYPAFTMTTLGIKKP